MTTTLIACFGTFVMTATVAFLLGRYSNRIAAQTATEIDDRALATLDRHIDRIADAVAKKLKG